MICTDCGVDPKTAERLTTCVSGAAGTWATREAGGPVCYLGPNLVFVDQVCAKLKKILSEEVPLYRFESISSTIRTPFVKILSEEGPVYRFETVRDLADPQLGPDDVAVIVELTEYDVGNRFVRFLLILSMILVGPLPAFLLAWLGVGNCKLGVNVRIRRGDGGSATHNLDATSCWGWGMFGGSGMDLMDRNFRTIAAKIARKVTGHRLLNITVYQLALASLALGLISLIPFLGMFLAVPDGLRWVVDLVEDLIPFLGMFLAVPGLILGIVAVAAIWARGLPKRKGVAIAGVLLCLLGPLVTVYLAMPPQDSRGRAKAVSVEPMDAEAYYERGVAYGQKGDWGRAIADHTKAIELKRDYTEAYFNRGAAYLRKGDYDRAIADYTKAIELKPGYAEAYYNRGAAYAQKGYRDRATGDFTKAIELDPRGPVGQGALQALRSMEGR